jgi:superfamily II DNA helicase RecQ
MSLEHAEFCELLNSDVYRDKVCAYIIDESHCISQWGGDFRPAYGRLDKLCSFIPLKIPLLATSATLPPPALDEVCQKLHIDIVKSFFLNMGNDRPNITSSVVQMENSTDYAALESLLNAGATSPTDLPKTIIFANSVPQTQVICRHVHSFYPHHLRGYIAFLHAHRTPKAKWHIMKRFRRGKIKILIATEAAGMVRMTSLHDNVHQ